MDSLPYVYSFKKLTVYQKSRQAATAIFHVSRSFPREEVYALTDQVRRSSRAIGANIAEAWAKRTYEKHFVSKLTDADAEQLETQHWLEVAHDCGYLSEHDFKALLSQVEEIGRLLGSMIANASSFCKPQSVREPGVEYFIEIDTADTEPLN